MRKHGLRVKQIRGGNQTDVDAHVETLVGTMADVGATHYWLGTDNYNLSQPTLPQLDAAKAKVERFVRLNEKHGTTLGRGGGRGAAPAGGCTSPSVPMGTGLVDVARYAVVLNDIGFSGPMELKAEYPNGGAGAGADTITRPRAEVLGMMTRDIQAIRAGFETSGTGLMI